MDKLEALALDGVNELACLIGRQRRRLGAPYPGRIDELRDVAGDEIPSDRGIERVTQDCKAELDSARRETAL